MSICECDICGDPNCWARAKLAEVERERAQLETNNSILAERMIEHSERAERAEARIADFEAGQKRDAARVAELEAQAAKGWLADFDRHRARIEALEGAHRKVLDNIEACLPDMPHTALDYIAEARAALASTPPPAPCDCANPYPLPHQCYDVINVINAPKPRCICFYHDRDNPDCPVCNTPAPQQQLARARELLGELNQQLARARELLTVFGPAEVSITQEWVEEVRSFLAETEPTTEEVPDPRRMPGYRAPPPGPRRCASCDELWPHPGKLCEPRDVEFLYALGMKAPEPAPACTCFRAVPGTIHAPDCPAGTTTED